MENLAVSRAVGAVARQEWVPLDRAYRLGNFAVLCRIRLMHSFSYYEIFCRYLSHTGPSYAYRRLSIYFIHTHINSNIYSRCRSERVVIRGPFAFYIQRIDYFIISDIVQLHHGNA